MSSAENKNNKIDDLINQIVNSERFINYCDNELIKFAEGYNALVFEKDKKNRISETQARAILNISYQLTLKYDELKNLADNRKNKSTNEATKEIWNELSELFTCDTNKDKWKEITKKDFKTPIEFVKSESTNLNLSDKEKKDFEKKLYAYFLKNFCIHFYNEYKYRSLKSKMEEKIYAKS